MRLFCFIFLFGVCFQNYCNAQGIGDLDPSTFDGDSTNNNGEHFPTGSGLNLNCDIWSHPGPPCNNYIAGSNYAPVSPYAGNPFGEGAVQYWSASHGSPQIAASTNYSHSPNLYIPNDMQIARMWASDGEGEGIIGNVYDQNYIPGLQQGREYKLSFFRCMVPDPSTVLAGFKIVLLTCEAKQALPGNASLYIPSIPANSQTIYCENNITTSSLEQIVIKFVPDRDYEIIWIFPISQSGKAWLNVGGLYLSPNYPFNASSYVNTTEQGMAGIRFTPDLYYSCFSAPNERIDYIDKNNNVVFSTRKEYLNPVCYFNCATFTSPINPPLLIDGSGFISSAISSPIIAKLSYPWAATPPLACGTHFGSLDGDTYMFRQLKDSSKQDINITILQTIPNQITFSINKDYYIKSEKVELYNTDGALIFSNQISSDKNNGTIRIGSDQIKKGHIYILRVSDKSRQKSLKIFIP